MGASSVGFERRSSALEARLRTQEDQDAAPDQETEDYCEEEDPRLTTMHKLCNSLAMAVAMREALPGDAAAILAALPDALCGLCLALAGDEGLGLQQLAIVERSQLVWSAAAPSGQLAEGTAAYCCFCSRQPLMWRRSCDDPEAAAVRLDWQALLQAHPAAAAVATVPLLVPGWPAALGAATFVLGAEPSQADERALAELAAGIASAITHHTKHLWEESLDFLNQVIPWRVMQCMMSAALSMHPPAAAGAAGMAPLAAIPATPQVAGLARSGAHAGCCKESSPKPPSCAPSPGCSKANLAAAVPTKQVASAPAALALNSLPYPSKPSAASTSSFGVTEEVKTLRQKWNLEFADPQLEESYKVWFNTLQTKTDLAVMRYAGVLLVALAAGLTIRGHATWGDVMALLHGLLSVAALAACMWCNAKWYIAHRSTVVACVRIVSAAILLVHVYMDPGFYSGSLIKALTGTCAITLVVNSFRNRLRFSNHLLVQLAKLYLCAMTNAFIYAAPSRAADPYFSLPTTTLLQLASALVPSLSVYLLERGMRSEFVRARLADSMRLHCRQGLAVPQPQRAASSSKYGTACQDHP